MYKVVKNKDNDQFDVCEIGTDVVVFSSPKYETSYEKYRSLNEGSGFAGFTPNFFAKNNLTKR